MYLEQRKVHLLGHGVWRKEGVEKRSGDGSVCEFQVMRQSKRGSGHQTIGSLPLTCVAHECHLFTNQ